MPMLSPVLLLIVMIPVFFIFVAFVLPTRIPILLIALSSIFIFPLFSTFESDSE